jgi:glycosyltransferase involved in cell wall biosynthesis
MARSDRQIVVMVTSSYPRFPGDAIATFMEPIAGGISARGHEVHVVAPWHPRWSRQSPEGGVAFHLFRYAPWPQLNVFGYAEALHADVRLRLPAIAVAPLAVMAGIRRVRRVALDTNASIIHAHWVVPGGVLGMLAAGRRPLVISLHGSDVFIAERHAAARHAARMAFRRAAWVTACSGDLRDRAVSLGAAPERTSVIPYGVDSERFAPDPQARAQGRARLGLSDDVPLVAAFGRLVAKKGFEYLVDAAALLAPRYPALRIAVAGRGDLDTSLRARAAARGVADRILWLGYVPHDEIPTLLASADVAAAPSVHDAAGNVDGLPNAVLEMMASGTAMVCTTAGGIGSVAVDGETARVVAERDPVALADAIGGLLQRPLLRHELGRKARESVRRDHSWDRVAREFENVYARITGDRGGRTGQ